MSDECVFKAGQEYWTRKGNRARIYATDGDGDYPIHGAIHYQHGGWSATNWMRDGRFSTAEREHNADLLPPEPEKVTRWVNVHRNCHGTTIHSTRESADAAAEDATFSRIARLRIAYHEGQFDE